MLSLEKVRCYWQAHNSSIATYYTPPTFADYSVERLAFYKKGNVSHTITSILTDESRETQAAMALAPCVDLSMMNEEIVPQFLQSGQKITPILDSVVCVSYNII